ncbi:MAG: ABC transporter permease [Dehalococcoidia bacterium]
MIAYIFQRILGILPVLFMVSLATFFAIRVLPGDLATARLGDNATPEAVADLRDELGLNRPLVVQYGEWISGIVRGDPGNSLKSGLPVGTTLKQRLPATIELAVLSIVVSFLIGIPLGVMAAVRQDRFLDQVIRVVAVVGQAVPSFWVAIVSLTLLSIYWSWAPPFEYRSVVEDPIHNMKQMLLPALILGYAQSATLMRFTRSAMLEVLRQDYIRTARAKGLRSSTVMWRHGLRNAMNPVLSISGVQLSTLIGGSLIIEQIFSLPGVGKLTLDAIVTRDYPQLQLNVLFLALAVTATNLAVDLSYGWLDPRLRIR